MGIMIEEAIEGLKTERQLSVDNMDIYDSEESRRDAVYYVSILETAIETMRKYQKIEQAYSDYLETMNPDTLADLISTII